MLSILRNRNFALIWFGGLVSLTGDWALITGVPLVVYQLSGSTVALGLTGMATALPLVLVGSIAGVFVDRWDRRRTMLVADVLLGVLLLPLVLVSSTEWLWLLVGVLVLESSIFQFYRPAEGALVPLLVPESELVTANALNGLSMNVARLAGPPLGALLVVLGGLSTVVLVDAASFLFGALTLLLVRVDLRPALASHSRAVAALLTGYLTLAQTSVDDAYRGRLLGLFFATTALSGLVGMALAGVLGDAIGIIPMLTLQCMG